MLITSMAGSNIHFNSSKMWMITGPRERDTDTRLYLFGITSAPVAVGQDAATFLDSLPNKAQFVALHFAKSNKQFWVHAPTVSSIHNVAASVLVRLPFAKAGIFLGGKHRYVIETSDQVKAALNAAGASF